MYDTNYLRKEVRIKFYVFLDVDGVLNYSDIRKLHSRDHLWMHGKVGKEVNGGVVGMFKSSVRVLNSMMKKLSKRYDVVLVVSSSWRFHMNDFIRTIYRCGFLYTGEIYRTALDIKERGIQIIDFLVEHDINAVTDARFVVVDDEINYGIKPYVNDNNIIHTDASKKGLTKKLVRQYLSGKDKVCVVWKKRNRNV